jgi:hypothetical protein
MSSRSATLTASRIFLSSTTTTAPESIATVTALTTYTSYTISTFVSSGTTYTQSEGHPVIVTDSAEFSSLSAAGAFQTASSSSTASTSSQTVRGKKGTKRPPGSKPLIRLQATCKRWPFHCCISGHTHWSRCWCRHWHRRRHPATWPHCRNRLVLAAMAPNASRKTASRTRNGSEATT